MMAPFSPQDCAALRRELESLADPAYKAFTTCTILELAFLVIKISVRPVLIQEISG